MKNVMRYLSGLLLTFIFIFVMFCAVKPIAVNAAAAKCTVKIYDNAGKHVQRTYYVTKGTKIVLPSIYVSNTRVLLGFSTKKKQHSSPSYYVGQTITVKKILISTM